MGIMSDVDRRWSVCDSCDTGIMSDVDRRRSVCDSCGMGVTVGIKESSKSELEEGVSAAVTRTLQVSCVGPRRRDCGTE